MKKPNQHQLIQYTPGSSYLGDSYNNNNNLYKQMLPGSSYNAGP